MVKNIEWDKTLKHNQSIILDPTPKDFDDVARWIRSSKIGYAVQTEVVIRLIHIQELWKTTKPEVIEIVRCITAIVRNKKVVVSEERIRTVLKLRDKHDDPISLNKNDILDGFHGM
ncbi:hypothetical protein Hanom_Chr05g00389061 [Helianthus anomalus]